MTSGLSTSFLPEINGLDSALGSVLGHLPLWTSLVPDSASVLIAGLALWLAWSSRQTARDANQLAGDANELAGDANELAGKANRRAG